MASIDKTYVNQQEYKLIRQFWIDTYEEQVLIFKEPLWLYPFSVWENNDNITPDFLKEHEEDITYDTSDDFPVWNTSSFIDIWLYHRCKIPVVQNRIKECYSEGWIGFHLKPTEFVRPELMKIKVNKDSIYAFKSVNEFEIKTLDSILVYGTTYLIKQFHESLDLNYTKNKVMILLFGELIEISKGKIKYKNKKYNGYDVTGLKNKLLYPSINYSFNKQDINNYDLESIYLSFDNDITALTNYNDYNLDNFNSYLSDLPNYILEYIK